MADQQQADMKPGTTETPKVRRPVGSANSIIFAYLLIGIIVFYLSDTFHDWVIENLIIVGGIGLLLLGYILTGWFRKGFKYGTATRQIGMIIFVVLPLILVLFVAISLVPDKYEIAALRGIFLLVVILLPPTLYYLFIVGRKRSLLQEYVTNLSRLGLLRSREETEMERTVRVMAYIHKFEAVYGSISSELVNSIITETKSTKETSHTTKLYELSNKDGVGAIFTPETAIPVVIATILISLGWLITLPPWGFGPDEIADKTKWELVLTPLAFPVNFAFLGAYFFSLQMLFRRYVRQDLRTNAYVSVSLRVVLAVIGIWVVTSAYSLISSDTPSSNTNVESIILVIAFVVGAFPPVMWQVTRAAFEKITFSKFLVPSLKTVMPISDLDGLTVWHEARLEEEDIENVPNMATADLVELMLNTKIPPDRIIDWADQAILYTHLGIEPTESEANQKNDGEKHLPNSARWELNKHGIRTATSLISRYYYTKDWLNDEDLESFEALLSNGECSRIASLVITLGTNPNLLLIQNWKRMSPFVGYGSNRFDEQKPNAGDDA